MGDKKSASFLTVEEVAEDAGTSEKTIYKMIDRGEIASVRFGRLLRVPAAAWERFKNGEVAA